MVVEINTVDNKTVESVHDIFLTTELPFLQSDEATYGIDYEGPTPSEEWHGALLSMKTTQLKFPKLAVLLMIVTGKSLTETMIQPGSHYTMVWTYIWKYLNMLKEEFMARTWNNTLPGTIRTLEIQII